MFKVCKFTWKSCVFIGLQGDILANERMTEKKLSPTPECDRLKCHTLVNQ
jgi:hypothetical protein